MNQPPPQRLTADEVAKALGVTLRTVYTLRTQGLLAGELEGRTWLYAAASVRAELLRRKGLA